MDQLSLDGFETSVDACQTSMSHLTFLAGNRASSNGKDPIRRATGRFYTPELIGRHLARRVAGHLPQGRNILLIDPFCGDGRLIEWLLDFATGTEGRWRVALWDSDAEAVPRAVERVRAAARRARRHVRVEPFVGDTFARAADIDATYDVVMTNPPWELLKPDRREIAHLSQEHAADYVSALRAFDARLVRAYPAAQPSRRFAGWGTNLARVGTDAALRLLAPGGVCGVVSPSSLFADSNSERLRRRIFDEFDVDEIAYYPAEARLFDGVDVPCATFVARRRQGYRVAPRLTRFTPQARPEQSRRIAFSRAVLAESGFVLPIAFGATGIALLSELASRGFPRFRELEAEGTVWAGRELDETRKERYLASTGEHAFLKGVNIRRFGICRAPTQYVDPEHVRLPSTVRYPRLAWRDVSRPNQRRRVQATLIPPGWVTGNSLGVAHLRNGDDLVALSALLAILSSIPFEYQLRSILSTGHVSLSSVRQVRLPRLDPASVRVLGKLAVEAMDGSESAEQILEVEAARAYGIDREEWALMLGEFSKLTDKETNALLAAWDR